MPTPEQINQAWKDSPERKTLLGKHVTAQSIYLPIHQTLAHELRQLLEKNQNINNLKLVNDREAIMWVITDEMEGKRLSAQLRLSRHDILHFHPKTFDGVDAASKLRIREMELAALKAGIFTHEIDYMHYVPLRRNVADAQIRFVEEMKKIGETEVSVLDWDQFGLLRLVRRTWLDGSYLAAKIAANPPQASLSYTALEDPLANYDPTKGDNERHAQRTAERAADALESIDRRAHIDSIFNR